MLIRIYEVAFLPAINCQCFHNQTTNNSMYPRSAILSFICL